MGIPIKSADVAVGQTVKDEDGARWKRTDTGWAGVTHTGKLTGSILVDRTMARKELTLCVTVEPEPAAQWPVVLPDSFDESGPAEKRAAELVAEVEAIVASVVNPPAAQDLGVCNVLVDNGRGRIVAGVPYEVYSRLPGENVSKLKKLRRSPLHYRHACDNPREPSKSMELGTAAHCATLEPERFADEFIVWAGGRRAGKAWESFLEDAERDHKTVLTEDEHATALAIAAAVRSCPDAAKYLATGYPEVSMEWTHNGHQCRGRVDWLTTLDGADVVVGLKTSRDCRPREFGRQSADLAYHWQWAFYHDGFEAITGRRPFMVEIVVESAAPHAVAVYIIGEPVMLQGRAEYEAALVTLAECKASGVWPGPAVMEMELELPGWAYPEPDDDFDIDEAV